MAHEQGQPEPGSMKESWLCFAKINFSEYPTCLAIEVDILAKMLK